MLETPCPHNAMMREIARRAAQIVILEALATEVRLSHNSPIILSSVVEDCFTPWLIHDEGEFMIFIIFKEFIFFRSQAFKLLLKQKCTYNFVS